MKGVLIEKKDEVKKDKFKGMMVTYIKKRHGGYFSKTGKEILEPIISRKGIMLAIPIDDGKVRIGWSLCNFTMGDKFGELGENIAIDRAREGSTVKPADSMIKPLEKFIARARRYYKDRWVHITFPKSVEFDKDEGVEITTNF